MADSLGAAGARERVNTAAIQVAEGVPPALAILVDPAQLGRGPAARRASCQGVEACVGRGADLTVGRRRLSVLFSLPPQHQEVPLTMTDFPLTGGCNCGAVRFEVTAPLALASYCHCKRCQRRSGAAASANAHPAPDAFRIVAGEDRLRVWKPDGGGEKWFCGDCGSSLFGRNPSHADPIGIRMGAFDGDPGIRPSVRQFVAYAAPWEPIPDDGLPRHPESRHAKQ